jgi:hypothetical protein
VQLLLEPLRFVAFVGGAKIALRPGEEKQIREDQQKEEQSDGHASLVRVWLDVGEIAAAAAGSEDHVLIPAEFLDLLPGLLADISCSRMGFGGGDGGFDGWFFRSAAMLYR